MKKQKSILAPASNTSILESSYQTELASDITYSLDVDPTNQYNFSPTTKAFIKYYIEYHDISASAQLCSLEVDDAIEIFKSYPVQEEIRRINRAKYHYQFSRKILSLNELGGYLTSLIDDADIPYADRLSTKDKLSVVKMLIDLNQFKSMSFEDPSILMTKSINDKLKDLSVGAIKAMLEQNNKPDLYETKADNAEIVAAINTNRRQNHEPVLTAEEMTYINSLSAEEAMSLLNDKFNH